MLIENKVRKKSLRLRLDFYRKLQVIYKQISEEVVRSALFKSITYFQHVNISKLSSRKQFTEFKDL